MGLHARVLRVDCCGVWPQSGEALVKAIWLL